MAFIRNEVPKYFERNGSVSRIEAVVKHQEYNTDFTSLFPGTAPKRPHGKL